MRQEALHNRLDQLASDVGRLRRRFEPESSDGWLCERIAGHIEALVVMLEPTASQLAATTAPGDQDAITEAIRLVDERHSQLRNQLGAQP